MTQIPVYYSDRLGSFDFGPEHPFRGSRFKKFIKLLDKAEILHKCNLISPIQAIDDDLLLAHNLDYLNLVAKLRETGGWLTMDTPVTAGSNDAQRLVSGSGLQACKLLLDGNEKIAHTFGGLHHAGADYGEGFCHYNDVAIAAKSLTERRGLERVMIVDTDAHQGNGTMDIFYHDPQVLFISIHQDPHTLYPGKGFVWETGSDEGEGFTVNIPMPPFSGNKQYARAINEIINPIAREFKPQFCIRNGGSDPFYADELTMLGLDYDGLYMVSNMVREIAMETSGNLLDMMLSGYGDLVIYGWLAQFCGVNNLDVNYKSFSPPPPHRHSSSSENTLDRATESMLTALKRELGQYWTCF
ncbi:MAG: hypothetical protein KAJ64_02765 [Thermoplasmata archaeon]|nr:hypothetical protein [Thermoplasmata archaeon]